MTEWRFFNDLRVAVRMLYRRPTFSLTVVLTLVLAIGVNVAVFTIVNAVLLQPLPYPASDRLVSISEYSPKTEDKFPRLPLRARDYLQYNQSGEEFSGIAAVAPLTFNLTGAGDPIRLGGARISADFFDVLGVRPELGRNFLADEDQPGHDRVVLISHTLWVGRFNSDRAILNQQISLDGQSFTIIGIMPEELLFPHGKQLNPYLPLADRIDVWKPMAFTSDEKQSPGSFNYGAIARLKPDRSQGQAQERLNGVMAQESKVLSSAVLRVRLDSLKDIFINTIRKNVLLLFVSAGLLLLLASINLANLMVAHVSGRAKEFATRRALGGGVRHIAGQILTESTLLAALGGIAGVFIAYWAMHLLIALLPQDIPQLKLVRISPVVLAFDFVISLLAGMIIGAIPVLGFAAQPPDYAALKEGGNRTGQGVVTRRLQNVMVIGEIALSTGLLVAAGLLLRSFEKVTAVDTGFTVNKIVAFDISLPVNKYEVPRRTAFFRDLVASLQQIPGTVSAGAITHLPLSSESSTSPITLDEKQVKTADKPLATFHGVTPGYFPTMGIALRTGRYLNEADFQEPGNAAVVNAVISASLAARLWPGIAAESVVGRHFRARNRVMPVIGVVADVRNGGLDQDPLPQVYIAPQYTETSGAEMTVVLKTESNPEALASALRSKVRQIDRNVPVGVIQTMQQMVSRSVAGRHFVMKIVLVFAVLSLAVAALGIYGVVGYFVSQTTRELGIRIALGAQRMSIGTHVLGRSFRTTTIGLLIGLVLAYIFGLSIRSFLFGVTPVDPSTLIIACCVIAGSSLIASIVPAWRASRIDPLAAIHTE